MLSFPVEGLRKIPFDMDSPNLSGSLEEGLREVCVMKVMGRISSRLLDDGEIGQ
jgi:hypothetical protein